MDPKDSLFVPITTGSVQAFVIESVSGDGKFRIKAYNLEGVAGERLTEHLKTAPESLGPNPNNGVGRMSLKRNSTLKIFALTGVVAMVLVLSYMAFKRLRGNN